MAKRQRKCLVKCLNPPTPKSEIYQSLTIAVSLIQTERPPTMPRGDDDGALEDPYSALRGQVQHAVSSGHFERAVELLTSLAEATSPRFHGEPLGDTTMPLDQSLAEDVGTDLDSAVLVSVSSPPYPSLPLTSLPTASAYPSIFESLHPSHSNHRNFSSPTSALRPRYPPLLFELAPSPPHTTPPPRLTSPMAPCMRL